LNVLTMTKRLEDYAATDWRPNQRDFAELVRAVATMPEPHRIGLEGPCGCGKSIGYLRPLFDPSVPPSMVLTTTRQHLKQLEETLERYWPGSDDWLVLRGRDHYGCCKSPRPKDGEEVDPEEVWASVGKGCPLGDDCRYRAAVIRAGNAKVVVQCTIGALYRRRFWSQLPEPGENVTPEQVELWHARQSILNRTVAVLDEAHEYLRVRREFETERLSIWPAMFRRELQAKLQKAREKWGGYRSNYVLLKRNQGIGLEIECEFRDALKPENLAIAIDNARRAAKAQKKAFDEEAYEQMLMAQWQARVDLLQAQATDKDGNPTPQFDPVVYVEWDGVKVRLVKEPLFINTKDSFAPREIYTSATLSGVAGLLGIDRQDWLHCFPPIFAREAIEPMPLDDNAEGSQKNVALDAEDLESIYQSEGRPLTIVLYLSKKAAHDACAGLAKRPGVFVQGLRQSRAGADDEEMSLGEMVAAVKQAAAEGAAPFFVTYGGWVGTDIPGDKWLVVGQAPKTPLAPYVEERQNRKMGGGWNDYEKLTLDRLQLAQGLGRALRTPEDRAVVIWPNTSAFRQLGLDPTTGHLKQ
jgi:Rad3-related DNA helicase